jgi:hypothetical protein
MAVPANTSPVKANFIFDPLLDIQVLRAAGRHRIPASV